MAVEVFLERTRILREWMRWARRITVIVRKLVADAEVYVIGSIARGDAIAASDIDILVVSRTIPENPREKSRLKALIEEEAGLPLHHPVQVHLVKPEEKEKYLRHGKYIRLA